MSVVVARAAILMIAGLMVFAGGFIYWQQVNQPSSNGCYNFPFGMGAVLSSYQGQCQYDSVPNYYASDIALILLVAGFLTSIVTIQLKGGQTEVKIG